MSWFNHVPARPLRLGLRAALIALCCLLVTSLPARPTQGSPLTPRQALARLFTASHLQADWFTPQVLAVANVSQLEMLRDTLTSSLGAYQSVMPRPDGSFLLTFARGTDVATIALDPRGLIASLFFKPPTPQGFDTALAPFRALKGQVSLLVTANGKDLAAMQADQRLAVGSAFKLAVLLALQRQIAAGLHRWDEVVTLRAQDRSLPSGILQDWPAGSHLTVEALASLMISQSDNTAADTLIHLVGRTAIDPLIPAVDRPLLSTHALFVLKDPARAALLSAYRRGNATQRLAVIEQAEALLLPPASLFSGPPLASDVEYHFSARELCALMVQVQNLPLMSINPGAADPTAWQRVAYKGGSDQGVINLTTALLSRNGTRYCVAATWNSAKGVDEGSFITLYRTLLGART